MNTVEQVPELIRNLYKIVNQLEELFPGRPFTPDGHLVGSIGEVIAAYYYGVTLLVPSSQIHDAKSPDGKLLQIKTTQVSSIALSSEPDHLLVLKLHSDGSYSEIYHGPGKIIWDNCGQMQKNGQRRISLSKIHSLVNN